MIKLTQLVILITIFSCSGKGESKDVEPQNIETITSVSPAFEEGVAQDTFLISEKRVGKYAIGDDVSSLGELRKTEGFIRTDINLQTSDLVELNMSDFQPDTQVLSILVE